MDNNLEKFKKLKELAEKRHSLFKELCQKCMASRIEPGWDPKSLTMEQLEECERIRKDIEQVEKEFNKILSQT